MRALVVALLANQTFVGVARAMSAGPRAATAAERQLLYALVPFEIAGKPITILEADKLSILVHAEDGKIGWIDAPNLYGEAK